MVTQRTFETTVQVGTEFLVRRVPGRGEGPDDELAARRQAGEALTTQMAQTADDAMAQDRTTHGPADHEPHPRGRPLRVG